jgi:hypothetical protein
LKRLLALTLLASGCELIDLDDLDDDDDDDMSESGDDDDDDDGDEGDDDGESGEDDGADPSADGDAEESDGGGPVDETGDGGAVDETGDGGAVDTGAHCEEGTAVCEDDATITVCVEGELLTADCGELCIEAGFFGALGCAYDEESGSDVCFCDDGSGGEGEGGA